jgi:hypothetical protein
MFSTQAIAGIFSRPGAVTAVGGVIIYLQNDDATGVSQILFYNSTTDSCSHVGNLFVGRNGGVYLPVHGFCCD